MLQLHPSSLCNSFKSQGSNFLRWRGEESKRVENRRREGQLMDVSGETVIVRWLAGANQASVADGCFR